MTAGAFVGAGRPRTIQDPSWLSNGSRWRRGSRVPGLRHVGGQSRRGLVLAGTSRVAASHTSTTERQSKRAQITKKASSEEVKRVPVSESEKIARELNPGTLKEVLDETRRSGQN